MEFTCKNLNETNNLALALSKCVKDNGAFITLRGDIGVGKTAFTRFLLKHIGIKETITSPTFVILNEYHSDNHISVYHFDLYRLENVGVKTIINELEEYSCGNNLTLVEWANFAQNDLPAERLDIEILYDTEKQDSRIFKINSHGTKADNILNKLNMEITGKNANSCI